MRAVSRSPRLKLTLICDRRPEVREEFPGLETTTDIRRFWDDPEIRAVVIATPPDTHAVLVEAALHAGKHVLCEKPLAMESETCRRLGDLARTEHKCLMVDCTPVYLKEIQAAQSTIPWSAVTEIHSRRWSSRRPEHKVSAIWDLAPHDLAVIDSWLGGLPVEWKLDSQGSMTRMFACVAGMQISVEVGYGPFAIRDLRVATAHQTRTFSQSQTEPEPLQVVIDRFAGAVVAGMQVPTDATQAARIADAITTALQSEARSKQSRIVFSA